jgi:hypothetical protein
LRPIYKETEMSTTLTATFDTRRQADMAVERLVQEFAVERTDIFVGTQGDDNSIGVKPAGSDDEAGAPSPEAREDGALQGALIVSVDLNDDDVVQKVLSAFEEFAASAVEKD